MKQKYINIRDTYEGKFLFKRDITGKAIYWKATVECSHDYKFYIHTYYGQLSGTLWVDPVRSISEPINGVNIGKSNATTAEEQAYSRLESEYKDHIKKGYKYYDINNYTNIEVIDNIIDKQNTGIGDIAQPMKFKSFEVGKCKYPMLGQPKINGVRCIALKSLTQKSLFDENPIQLLSKELTEYSAEHLSRNIDKFIDKVSEISGINNAILDGELYIYKVNVTSIAGCARNTSNPSNKRLQYIIYDLAIDDVPQVDRLRVIKFVAMQMNVHLHDNENRTPDVYVSPFKIIHSDEEAIQYLDYCLANGYEGCVLRPYDKEYAFGQRPSFNRKLKRFQDAEFEILDIIEYGTRDQKVGYGCKFICRNDITDNTFECIPVGDYETRMNYVDNKETYIGQKATVKFYERTINQLPFHGNVIAIRNYE